MIVRILGDTSTAAYKAAKVKIRRMGHAVWDSSYFYCDIAVAPLLTTKLTREELCDPMHGTLIFHPSPLPYGRGASSIRWAYKRKEPITAATWFWANDKLDAGDICESEVIKIDYKLSPREFYEEHVLPAMIRGLERCLNSVQSGFKRRVPQVDDYATYDPKL